MVETQNTKGDNDVEKSYTTLLWLGNGQQGPGRREEKKWPRQTRRRVRTKKVLCDLLLGPLIIMTHIDEGP